MIKFLLWFSRLFKRRGRAGLAHEERVYTSYTSHEMQLMREQARIAWDQQQRLQDAAKRKEQKERRIQDALESLLESERRAKARRRNKNI